MESVRLLSVRCAVGESRTYCLAMVAAFLKLMSPSAVAIGVTPAETKRANSEVRRVCE